jgi:hypothetical protein
MFTQRLMPETPAPPSACSRLSGTLTVVQERRFQLVDENGVCHRFLLDAAAPVDPRALNELVLTREPVTVSFRSNHSNLVAHVATDIALREEQTGGTAE